MLLQTVQEIRIVNTPEHVERLLDDVEYDCIDPDDTVGRFLFFESMVVLNLGLIRQLSEEEAFLSRNLMEEISTGFWMTLLHELRHAMQADPLLEHLFDNMEEEARELDAEDYAAHYFETCIRPLPHCIIPGECGESRKRA